MRTIRVLAALCLFAGFAFGQAETHGVRNLGILGLPSGSSLPATCGVNELFFKTGVTAGLNLYGCTSTNTWTLLGGGNAFNSTIPDLGGGTRGVDTSLIPLGTDLQQAKWTAATATGTNTYSWQPTQSVLAVPLEGSMLTATFTNQSSAASTIAYGAFGTYKLYQGNQSTQIGNLDIAAGSQHEFRFKQGLDSISISAATNASPVVLTSASHGLTTGMIPLFSGATGSWTPINGLHAVTVLTSSTFSIAIDSSGFGALAGSVVAAKGGFWQVDGGAAPTITNPNYIPLTFATKSGSSPAITWSSNSFAGPNAEATIIYASAFLVGTYLNYTGGGGGAVTEAIYYELGVVPTNWTGAVSFKIFTHTDSVAGPSYVYQHHYSVACGTPGTTDFTSALTYGSVTSTTVTVSSNANAYKSGTLESGSITPPTCAAGDIMMLRIQRKASTAPDNLAWITYLVGGSVSLPYTM